ncbi:MAG: hypothetical protein AB7O95_18280 [Geminicoccaceae bacterium]
MSRRHLYGLAVVLGLALLSGPASANNGPPPAGQWLLEFYPDPSLKQSGASAICLQPNGIWFALDFPIAGNWFLRGDRLRFVGVYPDGVFAAFGGYVSRDRVSGEFNDTNAFSLRAFGNGNFQITRTGKSCKAAKVPQTRGAATGRAYSG